MSPQHTITESPAVNDSFSPFNIHFYRKYFQLNTGDFLSQCAAAFNPIGKLSDAQINSTGDLYGPVWITATIVWCLFFSNTLSDILNVYMTGNDVNQNYTGLLLKAINLLYGYILLAPLLFVTVTRFVYRIPQVICYSRLVSIYGYANVIWGPASLFAVFRGVLPEHPKLSMILKWVVILLGGIFSGLNISTKIYQYLKNVAFVEDQKSILLLVSGVIFLHLWFTIVVKIVFFGELQ
ncbi:BA75_04435T0 [Komagataella pastoris]|uniref:BA75_04435T0 n=1 Tax=Komagataella pastoris TaxID=4922 RepID=A0A1B2JHU6_PICPA|nr:BA75_04435T0 [Komagataella pastoris]